MLKHTKRIITDHQKLFYTADLDNVDKLKLSFLCNFHHFKIKKRIEEFSCKVKRIINSFKTRNSLQNIYKKD